MSEKTQLKLGQLEALNEPLYKAYLHKESFFEFFTFAPHETKDVGEFLDEWVRDAAMTIPMAASGANLKHYQDGKKFVVQRSYKPQNQCHHRRRGFMKTPSASLRAPKLSLYSRLCLNVIEHKPSL